MTDKYPGDGLDPERWTSHSVSSSIESGFSDRFFSADIARMNMPPGRGQPVAVKRLKKIPIDITKCGKGGTKWSQWS